MTNEDVAIRLQQHAHHLTERCDNLYRIRAYRRAAETVLGLPAPLNEISRDVLERLPGIGKSLACTICHFVETGQWRLADNGRPRRTLQKASENPNLCTVAKD
jgi:DNA polymerase (family 10)